MTPPQPNDAVATVDKTVANAYYAFGIVFLSDNFRQWEAAKGQRFKEYRRAWFERPAKFDAGEFPLNLDFEVTTRCNLACTFCTQPTLTDAQLGDMPWDLFVRVADECERYQTPAANFNGLGEPLLVRRLPEMIRYAKERGFIDVMFHTNGTIMTEAIADRLIDSGLDRIIFSVDSPDKQTYEAMRLNANFDSVDRNVRMFADRRNTRMSTVPIIRTTMIVTDDTVQQVPQFVSRWQPVSDQITLQDLTWRTKQLGDGAWANKESSAIHASFDEIRDAAIAHKVGFACPYLFQTAYAYWNADVIPCSNPNARTQMVMGDLHRQSMHDVWNGKPYQDLRALHATGRWHEHPVCRNCEIPLIELYKTLTRDGVAFSGDEHATRADVVAEDLVPKDRSADDLALQMHAQSTPRPPSDSSAS